MIRTTALRLVDNDQKWDRFLDSRETD